MATPEQVELAKEHYEYVRPIPTRLYSERTWDSRADAVIHRITLNRRGKKVVAAAGNINPELKKILGIGADMPTNTQPSPQQALEGYPPFSYDGYKILSKPSRGWIFIAGCNNSGTTLLDYLLGLHPDIDPMKCEIHQIRIKGIVTTYPLNYIFPSPMVVRRPDGKRLNRVWTENLPIFREPIVEVPIIRYGLRQSRKTTSGVYTMGKSPQMVVKMPWMQKRLPRSRFVIIVRNGYCVAEGIRRRYNVYLDPKLRHGFKDEAPMTVARAARHWNKAHEVMLDDLEDLKDYAVIRYEDFCRDPADMLERLIEFFDLPPFDYEETLSKPIPIFKSYRHEAKIRNMNGESFKNLSEEDIADITREAEPMLKRFGYPLL